MRRTLSDHPATKYKVLLWGLLLLLFLLLAGQRVSFSITPAGNPLLINEFVAANNAGLIDEDGDFSDWIEIYNRSGQPVNLAGYALTDDPSLPEKWRFPDITLASGDYLLLFASGKNRQKLAAGQPLHTNFRLRQSGDFLGLYSLLDERFVDALEPQYPPQQQDMAYGRYGAEGVFGFLAAPTPGRANNVPEAWRDIVQPVDFSVNRGFFDTPVEVSLTTLTPGATIQYTTDGSEPTPNHGQMYADPLLITSTTVLRAMAFRDGYLPSPAGAQSYIFLNDVLAQPARPPGFPASWGLHQEDFKEFRQGQPVEPDYAMDPAIVADPRYRPELITGLTAIPSLSLAMDIEHFNELYSNPQGRGREWERPVSVELIEPDPSRPEFQVNAGLRIQGGVGRKAFYPKHSFRLFFRSEYGPPNLNHPLFDDSPVTEFDTLVLRGGVNRSFVGTFQNRQTTYARDEWLRASQIAMSGAGVHGTFVHLYINGLYWGLYNLVERPDAAFMAAYLGGDKEDWVVMNHGGPVDGPEAALTALIEAYQAFNRLDDQPERRDDLRAAVRDLVDIPQFFDYVILNWYAGNQDWGENNWYAAMRPGHNRLNYFVWDGEKIFFEGADIYLGKLSSARPNVVRPILELLLADPDLRLQFADQMVRHLYHDGALSDAAAQARWLALTNPLAQAIVGESARWGDARHDAPITQADWFSARDDVWQQMAGNADRLIAEARELGYYPRLDPPAFSRQGGLVKPGFALSLTNPQPDGEMYYTLDGSDPRQAGTGQPASGASRYDAPIVLAAASQIKARVRRGEDWSALNETTFQVTAQTSQLAITEIMYNPLGGSDYEFIELKNTGNTAFDLANASFEGIDFTFPANTHPLPPGEYLVLVRDPDVFVERYPHTSIAGNYDGNLSNSGETIRLRDSAGHLILAVTYDDERGWPISPDGRGDSLVLVQPEGDPNAPKSWQASAELYGSPGW